MRIEVRRTAIEAMVVSAARKEKAGSIPGLGTASVQALFSSVEDVESWL
jgi:hypothetical protein